MRTAYFDLDGTLVEDGLWGCLIRQLLEEGLGEREPLERCLTDLETPGVSGMDAVRRELPSGLRRVTQATLRTTADRAWMRVTPMPFFYELADLLIAHGAGVVLISGGPQAMVERVGKVFNTDRVYGSIIGSDVEPSSGRVIGSIETKALITRQAAIGRGDDLSQAIAMGNGTYDIGMLSQVGLPVAFEPSIELREEAEWQGWPIVDRTGVMDLVKILLES